MFFMYTIFFYFIVQLFCNYIDYCAADKYVKEENQIKLVTFFIDWARICSKTILFNIIIRCNIAGKLKITDLPSHLLYSSSPIRQTLIQHPIVATILLFKIKFLSMSLVSVPPHAQGLLPHIVSTLKVKTQEKSFKKKNYASSWNAVVFVGKAKNVAIGMVTNPQER